jgi:hypothetical protein
MRIVTDVKSLSEEAGRKLLELDRSKYTLTIIIREVESLRDRAWRDLLNQAPEADDLLEILMFVEPLREEARRKLFGLALLSETNYWLRILVIYADPLREEAGRTILARDPSKEDLDLIIDWVEPLREEAICILEKMEETRRRTKKDVMREINQLAKSYERAENIDETLS